MPTALVPLLAVPALALAAGAALCLLAAQRFTLARRTQPNPHPGWAQLAGHAVHLPSRDQQLPIAA